VAGFSPKATTVHPVVAFFMGAAFQFGR